MCQLPSQVVGVLHACVESLTTRGRMDVSRIAGHEYATDTIGVDHPHVGAVEGHPGHALDVDAPAGSCGDKASKAVFTDLWTRGARRERRRQIGREEERFASGLEALLDGAEVAMRAKSPHTQRRTRKKGA